MKTKRSKRADPPKKKTGVRTNSAPSQPKPEDNPAARDGDDLPEVVRPFPVVAVGASAGGLEAIGALLSNVSEDSGMAYVVIQHLDPGHESKMPEVLRRMSALPVTEARNGAKLQPNCVLVLPSNAVMTVDDGSVRLTKRQLGAVSMPVDTFFRSLALHHQSRAIGIVLSGTGDDGTKGLEAIKGEGGLTFAQDEGTARHYGMPGSAIAAGVVDFILPPPQIAAQLARIAKHPRVRARSLIPHETQAAKLDWERVFQGKTTDLATVFSLLRARTGVDFSLYKHATLRRRLARRMVLHKIESLTGYVKLLQNNPVEIDALFSDLLINVTSFFRDAAVFQSLKQRILPRLVKSHPAEAALRVWVCGCSTGEEAYSIAMTIVEFFEATRSHRPVQIFATDISDAAIEKARDGIYPESIAGDVSAERLRRFFVKVDGRYQVHKSIRDMCIFARQNVVVDPPFSNLDLISCRNVMIYLGSILQRKIVPIFHYALRPSGFLLLGNSETIGVASELFNLVNRKHKIFAKKHSLLRQGFEIVRPPHTAEKEVRPLIEHPAEVRIPDLMQQADRLILRDFSSAAVVVNSQMDVLHFRGRTGDYLEHAPGAASLNLLKMARESLVIDLRAAINKAIKQNDHVLHRGVAARWQGHRREITIEVVPLRMPASTERFFLVIFKEIAAWEAREREQESSGLHLKPALEKRSVARLREELTATKESLQSIIEEQEATNEELKSANEEIQSSNEELQSTNEELETAKEELQSTNEELTTLNEELQNRNGELTTVNNDLTNLLGSVNIAILMLSGDLVIRRFTPMAERLFNLIPSDMGRRLSDMNRSLLIPDLDEAIKNVIDNLAIVEREVQDREGRWYSLRIRPYRTRENRIDGAVLLLFDVDDLKRALDTVVSTVHQPLLVLTPDLRVKQVNETFLKTFGLRREHVENRKVYEMGDDGQWNISRFKTLLEAILPENKQVSDYELDLKNGDHRKKIKIQARLFYEESRGLKLIFLAFE